MSNRSTWNDLYVSVVFFAIYIERKGERNGVKDESFM